MSKRALVIFDWDGTLMNSSAKIVASMQSAALDCDLNPLDSLAIENIIGLGLPEAIEKLYPGAPLFVREHLRDRYSHHFVHTFTKPSPLFEGVRDLLDGCVKLGVEIAVATGKSRRGIDRVLSETKLQHYFVSSRCADETKSKPHPAMVLELLEERAIPASAAVVIGDTEYDLEMAARAQVASIGVTYGSHSRDRLERHSPIDCVDEPLHLLDIIRSALFSR
jgi:phosphoglycolate phosphatase